MQGHLPLNVIQVFAESAGANIVFGEWIEFGYFKMDHQNLIKYCNLYTSLCSLRVLGFITFASLSHITSSLGFRLPSFMLNVFRTWSLTTVIWLLVQPIWCFPPWEQYWTVINMSSGIFCVSLLSLSLILRAWHSRSQQITIYQQSKQPDGHR